MTLQLRADGIKRFSPEMRVKGNGQRGMTLIELMLALSLATVVMVAASGLAGLIAKTTGQMKEREGQREASQRTLGLMAAEFRELVQVVQVGQHDIVYETSLGLGAGLTRSRSVLRCMVDPQSGLTSLVHLSLSSDAANTGAASPTMSTQRNIYSHLTECRVEMGHRVMDNNGRSVSIHWGEVGKGAAPRGDAWLRIRTANAQGAMVPLWLGKVNFGV